MDRRNKTQWRRCGTLFPGSPLFWSASRCPPPPGSPCASMTAGCSATGRSSSARPVGTSSVFALYGLLVWLTPALLFRSYFLALVAILEVPAGATLGGAAGARVESASVNAKSRKTVIGAVLILIGLPVVLALIEAVSFNVRIGPTARSSPRARSGSTCSMSRGATTAPGRRRSSSACTAPGMAGPADGHERVEPAGRRAGVHRRLPVGNRERGPRVWHVGAGPGLMRDVRFISELIDTLEAAYNIDPTRIYANGLSNGGGMAFALSCTLSHRIAAVGMVAAAQTLPWSWCTDHRPVPMIAFHGTADPMIPYEGRPVADRPRPVPERPDLDGELGSKKPVRNEPRRVRGRRGCHAHRIQELRRRRGRGAVHESREEAIPGPAASRCRNGSSGPRAAASTPRA